MARPGDDAVISQALEQTLRQIEVYAPKEYTKLNADLRKKDELSEAIRQMAYSQLNFTGGGFGGYGRTKELALLEGLNFPTFRMEISMMDPQHVYWVKMVRDGQEFEKAKKLTAPKDVDWALRMQMASIVVETVTLNLKAVNVVIPLRQAKMKDIIKQVAAKLEKGSGLLGGVGDFIKAWKKDEGALSRAKALFVLLQTIFKAVPEILWTIFKGLLVEMEWYDWVLACARAITLIIAGIATGGAALVAKVSTIVLDAAEFIQKIANVTNLESIMGNLK